MCYDSCNFDLCCYVAFVIMIMITTIIEMVPIRMKIVDNDDNNSNDSNSNDNNNYQIVIITIMMIIIIMMMMIMMIVIIVMNIDYYIYVISNCVI